MSAGHPKNLEAYMSEHDPFEVEKEEGKRLMEFQKQLAITRATSDVVAAIGNMDDELRKEVLGRALASLKSSLTVSKSSG